MRDFGSKGPPRWRAGQRLSFLHARTAPLVLLAALALIGSLPLVMPLSIDRMNIDGGPPSAARGQPCRQISEAVFNHGWARAPYSFTFSGVTLARRRGDADCATGRHGLLGLVGPVYPVCEFDAPVQLAVTSHGRTRYFAVPAGYKAVVEARPDETRCIVTARSRLTPLPQAL
jgi:hypothetical protein